MNNYTINYFENGIYEDAKSCNIFAQNKEEAYRTFMDYKNWAIYSAWVSSVTYKNGTTKRFNTFSGKPY